MMGSSSSGRTNLYANVQKLDVDNRISLRGYFRMADNILKQAELFREEKNIIDLYILLLRFSSLVSETIPCHQDYRTSDKMKRDSMKKKLLNALSELDELKPAVKQMLNEKTNAYQNHSRSHNLPQVGSPSSHARTNIRDSNSFPEKHTSFSLPKQQFKNPFGLPNRKEKKETGIDLFPRSEHHWQQFQRFSNVCEDIQQMHPTFNQPTAPPVEKDVGLIMAIDASIQCALHERQCFSDAFSTHETSASSSSNGHTHSPGKEHISTNQTTATSDSIPLPPTPLASTTCVICLDSPVEGAFIPCGHMAGCMPCLIEIKAKNWGCPVCRAKVDQVIRLYAV